jgi:hypothetical protein
LTVIRALQAAIWFCAFTFTARVESILDFLAVLVRIAIRITIQWIRTILHDFIAIIYRIGI